MVPSHHSQGPLSVLSLSLSLFSLAVASSHRMLHDKSLGTRLATHDVIEADVCSRSMKQQHNNKLTVGNIKISLGCQVIILFVLNAVSLSIIQNLTELG